jgi:hypothetical protein
MTKKVQEKTQGVRELAGVIEQIASADKKGLKPPPTTDAFAKHMQLLAEQGKSTSQSPGLPPPPAPASTAVWPTAKSVPLSALSGKNKEGGK